MHKITKGINVCDRFENSGVKPFSLFHDVFKSFPSLVTITWDFVFEVHSALYFSLTHDHTILCFNNLLEKSLKDHRKNRKNFSQVNPTFISIFERAKATKGNQSRC